MNAETSRRNTLRAVGTLLCGALVTVASACGDSDGDSRGSDASASTAVTTVSTTAPSTSAGTQGATGTSEGGTAGESTGTTTATATEATSTTGSTTMGEGTTGSQTTGETTEGVGVTTGDDCSPEQDICCLEPGEIPPHNLLDEFVAVYSNAVIPKSVAEVQAFEPMVNGHMMAWSDENVGNELVDDMNGGVIEANIQTGRDLARAAAEMAVPVDAVILDIREDPIYIEDLGTPPPCIGVGWGWGSIMFENADESIAELVYLYVGICSNGDVERFYYSDQAVEICMAPE